MPFLALLRWSWFVTKLLESDGGGQQQNGEVKRVNVSADAAAISQMEAELSSSYGVGDSNVRLSFTIGKCEWRMSEFPEGILEEYKLQEEWKSQVQQPEIRMWGTTESGQKLCLHLWGVIPYFHIRPMALILHGTNSNISHQRSPLLVAFLDNDEASLKRMLPELESAMKTSMRNRKRFDSHLNLSVEYLTSFYGYNSDDEMFIRVNILNPTHIKPLVEELVMENILNTKFQPFGAHVPYLLQAFVDYDLAGFGPVHLSHALFRLPLPESTVMNPAALGEWLIGSTPPDMIWEGNFLEKDSTEQPQIDKGIIVEPPHDNLSKIRKSPAREATCELEADAHVLSLLNKSQAEKRRHFVPEMAVPSLDTLLEEEKLRNSKEKSHQALSPEAAAAAASSPEMQEKMRNVQIGIGFLTRPTLLRSDTMGTVLHRMERSLYHMAEKLKSSSSSPPGTMTQEMCEDIDFLAERKGVEDEVAVVVESILPNDEGSENAAAARTEGKEEGWNCCSQLEGDDDGRIEDEDELESDNNEDPWKSIEESQLEISQQSQPSSPPPSCEQEEGNAMGGEIQAENGRNLTEYSGAIVVDNKKLRNTEAVMMKDNRGEFGGSDLERECSSSSVVTSLESFLDEEAMKKKLTGTGGQGKSNAAAQALLSCDMGEAMSSNPRQIEENNMGGNGRSGKKPKPANVNIVERFFVEGTKEEEHEEYEMNDGEPFFHYVDPMEISVPPLGKEIDAPAREDEGLLRPANDVVAQGVKQIENEEVVVAAATPVWLKPLCSPPPSFTSLPMPPGFLSIIHTPVHYTDRNDVPKRQGVAFEGPQRGRRRTTTVRYWGDVPTFEEGISTTDNAAPPPLLNWMRRDATQCRKDNRLWLESSITPPPSRADITDWLVGHPAAPSYIPGSQLHPYRVSKSSYITAPTPLVVQNGAATPSPNSKFGTNVRGQYTLLSLEVHTQGELTDTDVTVASPADPERHPVVAVAWCFRDIWGTNESEFVKEKSGVMYMKGCTNGAADSIDIDRDEMFVSAMCKTCGVRAGGDSCLCQISFFQPRPRPVNNDGDLLSPSIGGGCCCCSKYKDPDLPGEPSVRGLGLKLIPHGLVEDRNGRKQFYYYFMKENRHTGGDGGLGSGPSQLYPPSTSVLSPVECDSTPLDHHSEALEGEARSQNTGNVGGVDRTKEGVEAVCCDTEVQLFFGVILLVRRLDPDFLVGWELMRESLGYLIERARAIKVVPNMLTALSRAPLEPSDSRNARDTYGRAHGSGIYIAGRTVLNLWRICRSDLKLFNYTRESVAGHCLKRRVPRFACATKRRWYCKGGTQLGKLLSHEISNCCLNLDIVARMDLVCKTAAMARILGIDFYDVLSRGSQFRVESILLRALKMRNMVPISPTLRQVKEQDSVESIPLVMEPKPSFYEDPVVVLDFQSLYPSVMIAYNLCFSTIFGHLTMALEGRTTGRLGVLDTYPEERTIRTVSDLSEQQRTKSVFLAPNGALFIHSKIREGVLPSILREVLAARLMVKKAQADATREGKYVASRNLDAKQLALKLVANVVYGYTAASFTGRMPMAELADAIVQCGRSTLESAVQLVENNEAWRAEVVYGDTDSMFVLLKGRSLSEAFKIGKEMADAVTAANPSPVKLKLEKVYAGSVMVTKKRYAGLAYDSGPDSIPYFDGKGIEAVRRDQCPLTRKLQERCLMELFTSRDASKIKKECIKTLQRVYSGHGGIKDLIFSQQVRQYYKNDKLLPPAAVVHARRNRGHPVLHNERVQFVIVCGAPNTPLRDLVVAPEEVMAVGSALRMNSMYYVTKHLIPALNRVLSLAGLDVSMWEKQQQPFIPSLPPLDFYPPRNGQGSNRTITQFFQSDRCRICGETSGHLTVCNSCCSLGIASSIGLYHLNASELAGQQLKAICQNCMGHSPEQLWGGNECCSLDCPIFFLRHGVTVRQGQAIHLCNMVGVDF